jgi:hypothetical protein
MLLNLERNLNQILSGEAGRGQEKVLQELRVNPLAGVTGIPGLT